MDLADLDTYGGLKQDAQPVEDPSSEISSAYWNKLLNDTAQMTRTACRAILLFPTVASGDSTPGSTRTFWGTSNAYFPTTVTRTGVGAYTVTYPSTFDDLLDEAETLSFFDAIGKVRSNTVYGHVQCVASGAVVTISVLNSALALADLTAGTVISVHIF